MRDLKYRDEEELTSLVGEFQRCRAVLTGFELGLFEALDREPLDSARAAGALGTDPRAMDRLMNALTALGLLAKNGGVFSLTGPARRRLVRSGEGFMGNLGHALSQWRSWSTLTEAVKKGGTVAPGPPPGDPAEEKRRRAFIAAMHARSVAEGRKLAESLDLGGVRRVLDVGGGSGALSMALVRAREGLTATVLDLPQVTVLTREYLAAEGLASRVETKDGDYHAADFGTGYDLVILSAILHINSPEENRALVARCFSALNPGGRLLIKEFIMEENRTEPLFGALFALNMLAATPRGDTYPESQIRDWLAEAGFARTERRGPQEMLAWKD